MLCCFDSTTWDEGRSGSGTSDFPGQRRFAPTSGNALQDYTPQPTPTQNHTNLMVSVVVPPGVSPGQSLQVGAPDGSGRFVMATVPPGHGPGSQFMVAFPPQEPTHNFPLSMHAATPPVSHPQVPPASHSHQPYVPQATPVKKDSSVPYEPSAPPASGGMYQNTTSNQQSQEKRIVVQVPPGAQPGTTLQVQIPDEPGRVVAATVPPGVSQFQVSYRPRQATNQSQNTAPPQPQPQQNQGFFGSQYSHNNAQNSNGYNTNRPFTTPNQTYGQHNPYGSNTSYNNNNNHNNNNNYSNTQGSGMGYALPMLAGGALLGGAGLAMYNHAHHQNEFDGNYEDGGGDAYGETVQEDFGDGDF